MTAYEAFEKIYRKEPQNTAFTPYRVVLLERILIISLERSRDLPSIKASISLTDRKKTVL